MKKRIIICIFAAVLCCAMIIGGGCNGCGGCSGKTAKTSYTIDCELSGKTLTGEEEVNFYNSYDNSFTQLKFNLFGNAFRKGAKYSAIAPEHTSQSYPNGTSYGSMEIESVTHGGKALNWQIEGKDQNVLSVELDKEVFPAERYTLVIKWTLKLADVVARTGKNDNTVNLGNFYPILCAYDEGKGFYECVYYSTGDPFYSECADYVVSITTAADVTVAASGKKVEEKKLSTSGEKVLGKSLPTSDNTQSNTEVERKKTTFKVQSARSFAMCASQKFKVEKSKCGKTEILYYYYNDASPKQAVEAARRAIELFTARFGEYPYETYSFVQTPFVQGGMEYPALTMISDTLERPAYLEVIVHETAHQWWQTAVGNNEIEYGFLDEGLAEYSVVLFYENYEEYGYTRKSLVSSAKQTYKVFCSVSDQLFGTVNTVMLRSLAGFQSEYEYVNMAYIKPCIMYDTLRETIGDDKFFAGLKRYYENYIFKNAVPDDLVGAFEKCGADTNGFFKSFFDGKVVL